MLLSQIQLIAADLDMLAVQLTGALEGPMLLYLSASDLTEGTVHAEERMSDGWQDLVRRVCGAAPVTRQRSGLADNTGSSGRTGAPA
jgi:hypothetical protein